MAKVIAFINFKGGVGKTANAVNIAACLALGRGKRVLVVDLDPQCNSTFWLLRRAEFHRRFEDAPSDAAIEGTVCQVFRDVLNSTHRFNPKAAIVRGVASLKPDLPPRIPNLHLLPGAPELFDIESAVGGFELADFRRSLAKVLDPLRFSYDYILLDCPPNLYYVAQTAIVAADHIVAPFIPDALSVAGLRNLCRRLKKFDSVFTPLRPKLRTTQVAALTINRYQTVGKAYSTAVAELKGQLLALKDEGMVHPKCRILHPPVRLDVKIAEATSVSLPVIMHAKDSIGASDYRTLTADFLAFLDPLS